MWSTASAPKNIARLVNVSTRYQGRQCLLVAVAIRRAMRSETKGIHQVCTS